MSRVLLINANTHDQPYPVYPLGLAYVSAALQEHGHTVRIWDRRVHGEPTAALLAAFAPDCIGVSLRNIDSVRMHEPESFVDDLVQLATSLRRWSDAKLVLGGSGFSVFPNELLEVTGADYGIQGEGERSFVALVDALAAGQLPDMQLPGLVVRSAGLTSATRAQALKLETLPPPAHDLEILRAYIAAGSIPPVQTQRGCPLRCVYCTYPLIEGKRIRRAAGELVADEFERLAALGVKYVFLVDSFFNTNEAHVTEVCEALVRRNTGVHWTAFLRPKPLSYDLMALMKASGMRHLEFGTDTLADATLKSYQKGFTFDDVLRATEYAAKLELHQSHFFIFGGPGETRATFAQTLERTRQLPHAFVFATIGMRVYPGTYLWNELVATDKSLTARDCLVVPRFYLAPDFTLEGMLAELKAFMAGHPSWVLGNPPKEFNVTADRLRKKGVQGPMWEYIELLQRLKTPESTAGAGSPSA